MARKSKHKTIWLNRGWYPFYYGFCPSEKAWNEEMKHLAPKAVAPEYPTSGGRCTSFRKDGKLVILVTAFEKLDTMPIDRVVDTMAHEATHVFQEMKEHLGEDKPSAEFEAYSMGAITSELFLAYMQTRRPDLKLR